MDASLLKTVFGTSAAWHGACTVLLDADTTVQTTGYDSIVSGGIKSYAPRVASGRVVADSVAYHAGHHVLLIVRASYVKQQTGEDLFVQTLLVADGNRVVGLEFDGLGTLGKLGVPVPPLPDRPHYTAGTLVG